MILHMYIHIYICIHTYIHVHLHKWMEGSMRQRDSKHAAESPCGGASGDRLSSVLSARDFLAEYATV